jgi:hypothetical protein
MFDANLVALNGVVFLGFWYMSILISNQTAAIEKTNKVLLQVIEGADKYPVNPMADIDSKTHYDLGDIHHLLRDLPEEIAEAVESELGLQKKGLYDLDDIHNLLQDIPSRIADSFAVDMKGINSQLKRLNDDRN